MTEPRKEASIEELLAEVEALGGHGHVVVSIDSVDDGYAIHIGKSTDGPLIRFPTLREALNAKLRGRRSAVILERAKWIQSAQMLDEELERLSELLGDEGGDDGKA